MAKQTLPLTIILQGIKHSCSDCYVTSLIFYSLNLQNEVGQADELREKNTRLERDKQELEKTLATLQVDDKG